MTAAITPRRDTGIDIVRAYAIAGVVGGHWLVTGLVLGHDGVLRQSSPLATMPAFAPLTWPFQTLGLFFFAGGYAGRTYGSRVAGGARRAGPGVAPAGLAPGVRGASRRNCRLAARPNGWSSPRWACPRTLIRP